MLQLTAKYVFDSNIFITINRNFPMDLFPSLWHKIDELVDEGVIISSAEVYDEIQAGHDFLAEWAKRHASCFLPSEIDIQKKVREILTEFRELVEGGKKMNNADPFVIALAMLRGCTVVTEEGHANKGAVPKIPNVCDKYNIKYLRFVNFMREMELTF